ncbi:condensation domain-containing protein [Kutzneria kofuensis]|uniref:CheY-like chemotaxis protein n=1 Tax=Kutzneria kofuensis TaxID=103725 RepID=A0A7W9KPY6_9PSEU|nr:condensation domain-containing protein [Kutzneria kofuensis]MBB5896502.1 CheY-like chemotaxis protein [Kutzneria kofuensis]
MTESTAADPSPIPLTFGQDHELPLAMRTEPPPNAIQVAVRIEGQLDADLLAQALRHVTADNDGLRMRLLDGTISRAAAAGQVTLPVPAVDSPDRPLLVRQLVKARDEDQFGLYVRRLRAVNKSRQWDLVQGPPYAFRLLRLTADHHAFLGDFSRFVLDGRGRVLFLTRLWDAYSALACGRKPAPTGAPDAFTRAARQQRATMDRRSATVNHRYWQGKFTALGERLAAAGGLTEVGTPRSVMAATTVARTRSLRFRGRTLAELRAAHERAGASLFQWVLAAAAVEVFRRWPDPVLPISVQVDTRDSDAMAIVGRFSVKLPLHLTRADDVPAMLRVIKAELLHALRHRHISEAHLRGARDAAVAEAAPSARAALQAVAHRRALTARLMDHDGGLVLQAAGLRLDSAAYPPAADYRHDGVDISVHQNAERVVVALALDSSEFTDRDADDFAAGVEAHLRQPVSV